jgi:hypothetical protein
MYIFELITKYLQPKKYKKLYNYDPMNTPEELSTEDCEHFFQPLDSSKEYFACKYCGLVVPKDKLKDLNIFREINTNKKQF